VGVYAAAIKTVAGKSFSLLTTRSFEHDMSLSFSNSVFSSSYDLNHSYGINQAEKTKKQREKLSAIDV